MLAAGASEDFPIWGTAPILDDRGHVVACSPERHDHAEVTALVGQETHWAAIPGQGRWATVSTISSFAMVSAAKATAARTSSRVRCG